LGQPMEKLESAWWKPERKPTVGHDWVIRQGVAQGQDIQEMV
jgi:hypothetical protein